MCHSRADDFPTNDPWHDASREFLEAEERRVDVFVAKARATEKEWNTCVAGAGERPERCVPILEQYVNHMSTAYCPMQVRDTNLCWKNKPESGCKDEMKAVWGCLEAYTRIAHLSLLSRAFDTGMLKRTWD
eukprot:TRINITY_DN2503_c0_g1_i1.p2 TRINITY_DN2503_c0_g1~~TRINITY_DN2503_c0_g1_i1.p2  ORF type:complete len:149 (+),score=23.10 TRINITY_DN2503_c0_g1_i1:56-448(+)